MIGILALLVCFTLMLRRSGLPSFETAVVLILALPIHFYWIMRCADFFSYQLPAHAVYLALFVLHLLALFLFAKGNKLFTKYNESETVPLIEKSDAECIAVFCTTFLFCYSLCLSWPDFFPLGERLRDFSLLASLSISPVYPKEPWLADISLNYYTYWYRFGQIFTLGFGESIAATYHLLQSFTYALFVTLAFRIVRLYLNMSALSSVCFSIIVGFGSNPGGLKHLFNPGPNWWWPTRIIPGGIHEFPVWSLLLGDAHPHYLNLPMIPLGIAIWMTLAEEQGRRAYLKIACLTVLLALFMRSANAWEVPMWLGISVLSMALLYVFRWKIPALAQGTTTEKKNLRLFHIPAFGFPFFLFALVLLEMGANFQSIPVSLKFVEHPIARTDLRDLVAHWGFVLAGLLAATSMLLGPRRACIFLALLLCAATFFSNALPFLMIILLATMYRLYREVFRNDEIRYPIPTHIAVLEGVGLCSIGLIITPEIIFLDDPYGGIHERMNTIFKLYYPAWFLLHLYVASLLQRSIPLLKLEKASTWILRYSLHFTMLLCTVVSCAFLYATIPERSDYVGDNPAADGLDTLERKYPGVRGLIEWLARQDSSVVLEVQYSAYSEGAIVATLAGQFSYLGWVNHVQLLYPGHASLITHRSDVTQRFYSDISCSDKLSMLKAERIDFAVLGPIEAKVPGQILKQDFSCLDTVYQSGSYRILGIP